MFDDSTEPADMSVALRALAGIVLGDTSFDAVLQRACEVTKQTVAGADEVSVTLIEEGKPRTAASSGELALRVDESQYRAGYGPCLDAARNGEPVVVPDLTTEERWPDYVPAALEAGVAASVSVPLAADRGVVGALNIYARSQEAVHPGSVQVAVDLAKYAGIVLTNADRFYTAEALASQMQHAMETRAVIEQAKGVLMAQHRCDADEAFARLVKMSQESHQKLRDVATALVRFASAAAEHPRAPKN